MSAAERIPDPALPGYEHFHRFWMTSQQKFAVKVKPGEFYVTRHEEVLTTVLGSCISACICDPVAGLGGMNHFMLPAGQHQLSGASSELRYGVFAMEQLINELMKFGAVRSRLEIKVVGGGNMMNGLSDVGQLNVDFITGFLKTEGFHATASDLGGTSPRKVMYLPQEGRMLVKRMANMHNSKLLEAENHYLKQVDQSLDNTGDVELF